MRFGSPVKKQDLSVEAKFGALEGIIILSMSFGSESWVQKAVVRKRAKVIGMKVLTRSLGVNVI